MWDCAITVLFDSRAGRAQYGVPQRISFKDKLATAPFFSDLPWYYRTVSIVSSWTTIVDPMTQHEPKHAEAASTKFLKWEASWSGGHTIIAQQRKAEATMVWGSTISNH